jgi:hypothetical protein
MPDYVGLLRCGRCYTWEGDMNKAALGALKMEALGMFVGDVSERAFI